MSSGSGFLEGKLPPDVLREIVFKRLGAKRDDVVLGPAYGEDAAATRIGCGKLLVSHSDPITAATREAGWLSVHVACNDVATRGARPLWVLLTILVPASPEWRRVLEEQVGGVDRAARELGVAVIGGHTEVTSTVSSPVLAATCLGIVGEDGLVTTSGARPGDVLVMTKTAGLEGTAIMATDYGELLLAAGVDKSVIERARGMARMVSVVREALILAEKGYATSMHDPTEGGVLGGVVEMAYASRTRIRVYEERIPVAEETRILSRVFGVDPLRLISSGVLLASVPRGKALEAVSALQDGGVPAAIIGEVVEGEPGAVLVKPDGGEAVLPRHIPDEVYRLAALAEKLREKLGRKAGPVHG